MILSSHKFKTKTHMIIFYIRNDLVLKIHKNVKIKKKLFFPKILEYFDETLYVFKEHKVSSFFELYTGCVKIRTNRTISLNKMFLMKS